ncbi:hypothetical protein Gohar_022563 [Gossypium harknessii]|uniref:Uncharacterized protein n=2 Tax=Gossypium TaxID=3633 RepID=A0A7J8PY08_GOSRA|nr:hypothetical protein [Gossypium raimondii]MBA0806701.1 hypothetical protein [Gossypium harknessii]
MDFRTLLSNPTAGLVTIPFLRRWTRSVLG